jgi:hypothetical protein
VTHAEWQLVIGDRAVSRGNIQPVFIADAADGDHVSISLEMPPVKPGVAIAGKLNVTLHTDTSRSATLEQPLFIFADDPFVDREQWLRELNIRLFDPNRTTQGVFEKHGIAFKQVTTAAAIDAVSDGVLIIGEGLSWNDYSGAIKAARRAAHRGRRVLCLAPSEGDMPLYSESADEPTEISTMFAAQESVLKRFDKRFDTREWLGEPSVVSRLGLVSEKNVVLARVTDSSAAWPWLEMHWGDSSALDGGGVLVVCGFGIIKYWDAGPVPRYLLSAILEPPALNRE